MCLQHEIVGDLLDTADRDQVRAAGAVPARLQDALAAYPDADRVAVVSVPLTARVTGWLDAGAGHLPATARDALRGLLADAPPDLLPTQLVHHDFRCCSGEPWGLTGTASPYADPAHALLRRVCAGPYFCGWVAYSRSIVSIHSKVMADLVFRHITSR
jgi:hypothetical protein